MRDNRKGIPDGAHDPHEGHLVAGEKCTLEAGRRGSETERIAVGVGVVDAQISCQGGDCGALRDGKCIIARDRGAVHQSHGRPSKWRLTRHPEMSRMADKSAALPPDPAPPSIQQTQYHWQVNVM